MADHDSNNTLPQKDSSVLDKCCKCNEHIVTRDSKLLPCLHTLCAQCWPALRAEAPSFQCPDCKQQSHALEVIDNLFIHQEDDVEKTEERPSLCTSCEENAEISSYCVDCVEYLCNQCVQAHRRVRITKDHKIVAKDMVETESKLGSKQPQKTLFCPEHHQEQLKLYCETCQQLTCRDCQLQNHKDHKYLFLQDASEQYVNYLKSYIMKIKEKMSHVDKAKGLIDSRNKKIHQREEEVEKEIKTFATKLMYEIQNRGRTLIADLKALCKAKRNQLLSTGQQVNSLYQKLCHCLEFVEGIMGVTDNIALLHSRKLIVKQLNNITLATCEVPNPNHNIDIRFQPQPLAGDHLRVGALQVDGSLYRGYQPRSEPASAVGSSSSSRRQEMARKIANMPPDQREHYMRAFMNTHTSSHTGNHTKNIRLAPKPPPPPPQVASTALVHTMLPVNPMTHRHATGGSTVHHQPLPFYPGGMAYVVNQSAPVIHTSANYHQPATNGHMKVQISGAKIVSQSTPVFASPQPIMVPSLQTFPNSSTAEQDGSLNNCQDPKPTEKYFRSSVFGEPTKVQQTQHQLPPSHSDKPPVVMATVKEEAPPAIDEPSVDDNHPSTVDDMVEPPNLFDDLRHDEDGLGDNHHSNVVTFNQTGDEHREHTGNSFPISDQMLAGDDDPSEDYCAVCHNGGDLLCCDTCPKVFHLQCHVPNLVNNPSGDWQCGLCTDLGTEDQARVDHAGNKRKAPTGLTDYEIKVCERILLLLYCHSDSPPFHEPVSKSVPNYYKVITNPMDFSNIKCKLSRSHFNHYDCVQDFISDVKLVFSNCGTYNAPETPIWKAGRKVEEYFGDLLHRFLPTEVTSQGSAVEKHVSKRKKKPEDIMHYQA